VGSRGENEPISRQCLSILLLSAIFSSTSVQTGDWRTILAMSALTETTRAPEAVAPMLTRRTSPAHPPRNGSIEVNFPEVGRERKGERGRTLGELGDLGGLLLTLGLDTEQTTQHET
jgi:hypothetical protein